MESLERKKLENLHLKKQSSSGTPQILLFPFPLGTNEEFLVVNTQRPMKKEGKEEAYQIETTESST